MNLDQGIANVIDKHVTAQPFVKDYTSNSQGAWHTIRDKRPCKNMGQWVDSEPLMSNIRIERSIDPNGNGGWKFTITKSGYSADINPLPSYRRAVGHSRSSTLRHLARILAMEVSSSYELS